MGFSTLRTLYPGNLDLNFAILCLYIPVIIAMNGKTGGMPALAGELVDLDLSNNRIIKSLRKSIEIFD
jgi:hypothetical protein